ncbi:unnamed protein product [Effrenium voratum]|nr:unnamed protein product [Effrenium voratum]
MDDLQQLEELRQHLEEGQARCLLEAQKSDASIAELAQQVSKLHHQLQGHLPDDHGSLLRQEQRKWQEAFAGRASYTDSDDEDILGEFRCCTRLQTIMTNITRLITQHAEGEARLIQAEMQEMPCPTDVSSELQGLRDLKSRLQQSKTSESKEAKEHPQSGKRICSGEDTNPSEGPKVRPDQVATKEVAAETATAATEAALGPECDAEPATNSEATAKAKGKGTAKGKGKGKGPPLPKAKAMTKAAATAGKCERKNLVTLHWKALPAGMEVPSNDPFLQQCVDMVGTAGGDSGLDASPGPVSEKLGGAFSEADCMGLPASMVEVYFRRREAAVQLEPANTNKTTILDEKQCRMLGILMGKYRMKNKDESERRIVNSMKRAVLSCRYDVLKEEGLSMLRKVIRDAMGGNNIMDFVKANGASALKKLKDPWLHRLVYEVLKVPQIEERLECMLFQTAFEEGLAKCKKNMEVMCKALQMLSEKHNRLRELFMIAHRFGTALNSNCLAPQAPQGFSLTSLEKLAQTRSTASPKHNMLHFVLAMMTPESASGLFSEEDLKLLTAARATKSYTVYQDCTELTQGFYAIREMCETGKYKSATGERVKMERRRMTKAAGDEEAIDTDDCFHSVLQAFVEKYDKRVQSVAQGCYCAFIVYKEQALFFDDLGTVYPPPKDDQDSKVDLLAVMHKLAVQVRKHAVEVEQAKHPVQLGNSCNCSDLGV